ncbi:MAG: oxidoreductase [Pelagibacterium sp. SCN 64-44]|nr:MAG: oxidoreductase [Pelagibacterium sp. SCN 64-44]
MVAETHIKALRDLASKARIVGVHARRADVLDTFCANHGVPAAHDLDVLLSSPDVQVVLVLTPPNARAELVRKAVAAGKHVLMEKPIERAAEAAAEIVDMVEAAGLTLGIVFQHRFRIASLKLAELCAGGTLGALCAAQIAVPWWRPQSYYDVEGRGTYARDGGGVLISQAIHTLDLMQMFTGPVESVQAIAGTTGLHRMEAEDFVAGGLIFSSGALGSLIATTASFPGEAESIVLDFERASTRLQSGTLVVQHHDGRKESFGQPGGTGGGADPMAFTHDWHRSAIEDFIDAVAAGRLPSVTGRAALATHRLINALVLSAREGRRVSLSEIGGA